MARAAVPAGPAAPALNARSNYLLGCVECRCGRAQRHLRALPQRHDERHPRRIRGKVRRWLLDRLRIISRVDKSSGGSRARFRGIFRKRDQNLAASEEFRDETQVRSWRY